VLNLQGKIGMDLKYVLLLIEAGEGQRIEFKESIAEEDDAIRSLCAFAHTQGGTVLFGISNDGVPKGISIGRNTLENFASKLRSCSQPPLLASIENIVLAGKNIVAVSIEKAPDDRVLFVFGNAYVRVGKTNQLMSPNEIRDRYFVGFKAENLTADMTHNSTKLDRESWDEREKRRCKFYEINRGLFLVHTWRPSREPGQVADIVIYVAQHSQGPLTRGTIKSVDYHLGPKFFKHTVVKSDSSNQFRLEVSAYAPMLCLALVHFDDGSPTLELQRYVDFWPSSNKDSWAQEKTETTIQFLLEILGYMDRHTDLSDKFSWGNTVKEEIEGRIFESFYQLTKLLSNAYDASNSWTPEDRELLMARREQGLEQLTDLYRIGENRYKGYLEQNGNSSE
jgi:hypothetical protein